MENYRQLSPALVESIARTEPGHQYFFKLSSNSHMCRHSCEPKSYTSSFHSAVPTPAQLGSLGNLLEMRSLGSHPKSTEPDTLSKAQQSLTRPPGDCDVHYSLRITVLELFFHKNHPECLSKMYYLVS